MDQSKAEALKALALAHKKRRQQRKTKATEKPELTETKGERMAEKKLKKAAELSSAE